MTNDSAAANTLGTIGTVLWCVQLVPQIYFNYRKKNCEGLPPLMLFLWSACGVPFAIYFISIDSNIPVQVQPCVFTVLCLIGFVQSLYYPPVSWPTRRIILVVVAFVVGAMALEVGFIIPLKRWYQEGTTWPPLIFGILASILLAAGLIPPYFELWKRQGRVIGINFIFLTIDFSGAVFSLASLAVDTAKLDIMGCVLYAICALLELGIFASQLVWLIRFRWLKTGRLNDAEDIGDKEFSEVELQATDLAERLCGKEPLREDLDDQD
ncbi:hypothetical protein BABINDRAFT_163532 [Babjeviella inositovora NRRL Y-12698]|uniref:PQ-loop repeat-containing protein n=1 Tax=Babjeviella inositovora NRRL Y-12698 TaxID=984486 RepID=A0A1E3QKC5_9ASCO|nr:uncharacterized protein BABINDRAFT_163532 [Babjeviella inositovora NRRL Y-12698]ODQ77532.1 hypothetical protein BABINDRAFT_163532 [Babjeviella inositovora NRRL Y-12698]